MFFSIDNSIADLFMYALHRSSSQAPWRTVRTFLLFKSSANSKELVTYSCSLETFFSRWVLNWYLRKFSIISIWFNKLFRASGYVRFCTIRPSKILMSLINREVQKCTEASTLSSCSVIAEAIDENMEREMHGFEIVLSSINIL